MRSSQAWHAIAVSLPASPVLVGISFPSFGSGDGGGLMVSLFFGAWLLAFLGEVAVPVPFIMEGVLLVVGFQVGNGHWEFMSVLAFAVIGRQMGAAVLYWLARLNRKVVLNWLSRRPGKLTAFVARVESYITIWGTFGVLLARLIPGLIVPASISSGTLGIRYLNFAAGVAASGLIWDGGFILLGGGLGFGTSKLTVANEFRAVLAIGVGVALLIAIGVGVWLWRRKKLDKIGTPGKQ